MGMDSFVARFRRVPATWAWLGLGCGLIVILVISLSVFVSNDHGEGSPQPLAEDASAARTRTATRSATLTASPGPTPTPTTALQTPVTSAPDYVTEPTAVPVPATAPPAPPPPAGGAPECNVFPTDNPWNTDVSAYPVHPQSDTYVTSIGRSDHLHPDFGTVWDGAPIGIPYVVVGGSQPKVPVAFDYTDESDPGPYPIPPNAPIEGGANSDGDRHVIVLDKGSCMLYEMFYARAVNGGQSWIAGSGAVFNLRSNALRPDYWTSADAAGLPIFAGLARYDE
ncbi:MAG: hypothetical protein ABIP58_03355, partial [Dehalococcoidia bacterium]